MHYIISYTLAYAHNTQIRQKISLIVRFAIAAYDVFLI